MMRLVVSNRSIIPSVRDCYPCLRNEMSPISPEWTIGKVAPRAGLEPATLRLTAGCSAIELPRNAGRAGADTSRLRAVANLSIVTKELVTRKRAEVPQLVRVHDHAQRHDA